MECGHWRSIKAIYGLTRAEWEWLHDAQSGVCALCGEPEVIKQRLSVDHDHACCGKAKACKRCIRGLLCGICNRVLGHAEARPALVPRFADYLKRRPFLSVVNGAEAVTEDVGWSIRTPRNVPSACGLAGALATS